MLVRTVTLIVGLACAVMAGLYVTAPDDWWAAVLMFGFAVVNLSAAFEGLSIRLERGE